MASPPPPAGASTTNFGFDHVPAALEILSGVGAGERYTVHGRVVIGRSVTCDVVLVDDRVSRVHAEISCTRQGYVLRDLDSSNGVLLNGRPVQTATLTNNDEITLGDERLKFTLLLPAEARTAADVVIMRPSDSAGHQVRMPTASGTLQFGIATGRMQETQRVFERLQALERITGTLGRLRELDQLYPLILDEILVILPADRAALFRMETDGRLAPQVVRNREREGGEIDVSQTIMDEVVTHRVNLLTADARSDAQFDASASILEHNIRSVVAVPLEYDADLLGVLYLDTATTTSAFTEDDLRFVVSVAGVAAVAIRNALALNEVRTAGEQLNRAYLSMMAVLANAIEARDHYTIGHTWRVTRFTQVLARHLGWSPEKIAEVEIGGVLHDIGKIGVPDAILRKPGPLSPEEYAQMQLHPEIGARMLQDVPHLQHIIPYVLHHQERWDGRGYPHGLAGADVPIEGRVLAVADALDAMTSTRPYRRGMDPEVAMEEVRRQRGKQFDPEAVDALLAAYEAGDLTAYLQVGMRDVRDIICPFCSTYFAPGEDHVAQGRTACPTCGRPLALRLADDRLYAELA